MQHLLKVPMNNNLSIIQSTPEEIDVLKDFVDDDYRKHSEMGDQDRAFLNTLILRKQPAKILEVGVSKGGASIVILNAIKNIENSHLYSLDYNTKHYRIEGQNTGFYVDNYPELKSKWTLMTGGLSLEFLDEIGGDIDFCLIDTYHSNPGEIFDVLMILPYFKKDATIVLHDINLHVDTKSKKMFYSILHYTNCLLMSAITGQKLLPDISPYQSSFHPFPNIGAIEINDDTIKNIFEIFNLLTIKWQYMLTNEDLDKLNIHINRFYGEYYAELFKEIVILQKDLFNSDELRLIQQFANSCPISAESIFNQLITYRIDIKNYGKVDNDVKIINYVGDVQRPAWFANAQGIGSVLQQSAKGTNFQIKAIKEGVLALHFRGTDIRKDNVRCPVWINYKTIKINGQEILEKPVATWHDKPYKFQMSVKDGQAISVEMEQVPYHYSESELKKLILQLEPNSSSVTQNIDSITSEIHKKMTVEK